MITKGLLIQLYGLLSQASLEKCAVAERIEIVKALRNVRGEVEAFQGFVNDVQQKNQDIISAGDQLKIAELNKVIADEANKPVETENVAMLSEDAVMHLLESNGDWNAAVVMAVEDVFLKE